jgi:putative addiction module component (TIGR02574 family)
MTAVEQILQHALALPIAERIALADRLDQAIRSAIPNEVPEEDGTNSEELLAELDRRVEQYLKDPSTAISGDELIARLRRQQAAGL